MAVLAVVTVVVGAAVGAALAAVGLAGADGVTGLPQVSAERDKRRHGS